MKGFVLHYRNCGRTATLQISNTGMQPQGHFICTFCCGTVLGRLALWGRHASAGQLQPETASSQRGTTARAEITEM